MIYPFFRLISGIFFLSLASYKDIKTREIKNWIWIVLSSIGVGILLIQYFTEGIVLTRLLGIPLMIAFAYLFFFFKILAGADAKALIALALLAPIWPKLGSFPFFPSILPFPFVVFVNSICLVIPFMIVLCFYNLIRGNREFPYLFFGYKVPVEEAKKSFVWPIEVIKNGKRKLALFQKEDKKANLENLKALRKEEVWITTELPFALFLLIGFILTHLVGDLISKGVILIAS
jgi:hypothetical protein